MLRDNFKRSDLVGNMLFILFYFPKEVWLIFASFYVSIKKNSVLKKFDVSSLEGIFGRINTMMKQEEYFELISLHVNPTAIDLKPYENTNKSHSYNDDEIYRRPITEKHKIEFLDYVSTYNTIHRNIKFWLFGKINNKHASYSNLMLSIVITLGFFIVFKTSVLYLKSKRIFHLLAMMLLFYLCWNST